MASTKISISLVSIIFLAVLTACGGGGGGGGTNTGEDVNTSPQLSGATSLLDYINNFSKADEPTKARWRTYNSNFDDFPDLIMFANGMKPIEANSLYTQWPVKSYPEPVGEIHFLTEIAPEIYGYEAIDLKNGLVASDISRVYWGVKNIDFTKDSRGYVEFLVLVELIVTLDDVPQYRSTIIWEGQMCTVGVCEITPEGVIVDFPGEWLTGLYVQTVDEVLLPDPESYPLGIFQSFGSFWQRMDTPTGYPGG